jgi:hypothetical protein
LVRSFAIVPAHEPARTGRPGSLRPRVGVGVTVGAAHAYADALGFARGVGLHVILGIAITDAGAFVYAVAVTLRSPGAVTISCRRRPE